jgi:hypothetical protein
MQNYYDTVKKPLAVRRDSGSLADAQGHGPQVAVPASVFLPLPKSPHDEISVPASINGRDLSTGRL